MGDSVCDCGDRVGSDEMYRGVQNLCWSCSPICIQMKTVVATTRWNGTCDMLTSAKLSEGYLVVEITRELNKEPSLHCYPIYISYRWSMLQQCIYLMSTPQ